MSNRITGPEIEQIGRSLFGDQWRPRMAEAFGRTRQTIYAWRASGVKRDTFAQCLAHHLIRMRKAITEAEGMIIEK